MNILAIIQLLFAALNPAAHNSLTTLIQDGLNALNDLGVITLAKPLAVDGVFGLGTFAAVKVFENRLGLGFLTAEPLATWQYNLLSGFLAHQAATPATAIPAAAAAIAAKRK